MRGRDPMDGRLSLASVGSVAAAGSRVVRTMHLDHFPFIIFYYRCRCDEESIAQANLPAGRQAVILLGRVFAEVILLDVEYFGKWHLTFSGAFVFRIVDGFDFVDLPVGIVIDHYFQRPQHRHYRSEEHTSELQS